MRLITVIFRKVSISYKGVTSWLALSRLLGLNHVPVGANRVSHWRWMPTLSILWGSGGGENQDLQRQASDQKEEDLPLVSDIGGQAGLPDTLGQAQGCLCAADGIPDTQPPCCDPNTQRSASLGAYPPPLPLSPQGWWSLGTPQGGHCQAKVWGRLARHPTPHLLPTIFLMVAAVADEPPRSAAKTP